MENNLPTTLTEAIETFADPSYAHSVAVSFVWPDGMPTCHHCGSKNAHFLAKYLRYRCRNCRKDFTVKNGTIFEDSPLPLSKWMTAMWLICNCKNGISSNELSRDIGVTQRTAWFMNHRIREAMKSGSFAKINGTAEIDETFVGGLEKNKHKDKKRNQGRGGVGKAIVMGVLERGNGKGKSRINAKLIPNTEGPTLKGEVSRYVQVGSWVYTDGARGYIGLDAEYAHSFVDHAVHYAIGAVHTNGVENFWSLLKRGLKGTYIAVQPFHLTRYVDEQAWRFNNREYKDGERFLMALASVGGKRLDYATLTSSFETHRDQFGL